MGQNLGTLERKIMYAILQCGEASYGREIHKKIISTSKYRPELPSIYVVLRRLEKKKFLSSEWIGERRYYKFTQKGRKAYEEEDKEVEIMRDNKGKCPHCSSILINNYCNKCKINWNFDNGWPCKR